MYKIIKVVIVDDHAVVREGLRQLISSQPDMELMGEAADSLGGLKKVKELNPDIVIIDIAMPRMSGLELIRLIKKASPDIRMVVLSMYNKEAFVHQALSFGALGYVLKAAPSTDIIEAIRAARQGEYFLSSKIKTEVIKTFLKSPRGKTPMTGYDLLSEREQQIFRLVVEGNSTKKIAEVLFLSPKTIENIRGNIMKKLGIHDLVGLMQYAIKIGIIDSDLWEE